MQCANASGNTPIFEIKNICSRKSITIYAKAEFLNITGSVKDRAAKAMIDDGIRRGLLTKDKTIIDATSGNTGIAYSMIGAALGYKVTLTMPQNVTPERKKIMKAYGAQIIETSALEGIDGAYNECRRIVAENPDKYFYPDQYSNDENWKAHYNSTAEEIISQTKGKITHFVAGCGTSGTFTGCSKKFKSINPDIKCYIMTPDSVFHGIEGIKHCTAITRNSFFDESIADGKIEISTETAYKTARLLVHKEGIFAGISSGANIAAALKLAETAPDNSVIVTVLCDNGFRYLSGSLWED